MKIKILMVLITFFDLIVSTEVFARANKRYSRARRTKVAGSRGNNGGTGQQKKQQEQNLMEDYRRFLYPTYGKTLEYGQSYNIQDMLRYDVHKYYKEHGSEKDLNEQFCFGPYMKLTSNVTGVGGEMIDLKAGDGTICTYIKPNTNYAITLTDATEKQVSNAVKKNATPCMTSADKRRVCITRNGQDLQTMHLTSEMYLDTKPYITSITEAINKVKTSCGEFTKTMADINKQLGLGVSLTSGFAMALSGAATAVGYMNYKATQEQEELITDYGANQRELVEAILNSKLDKISKFPTREYLEGVDWANDTKISIEDWFIKPTGKEPEIPAEPEEKYDPENDKYRQMCSKFLTLGQPGEKNRRRVFEVEQGIVKIKVPGKDEYIYMTEKEMTELKTLFKLENITKETIDNHILAAGNCCEKNRPGSGDQECVYPKAREVVEKKGSQGKKKQPSKKTEYENEMRKLLDMQNKLKSDGAAVKAINTNHKKSRNLDITTAALSGTSAVTSTIGMGLSIAAIQSVEKSLIQLKQCKKDVNDLKLLNKKYIALQDEADSTGE